MSDSDFSDDDAELLSMNSYNTFSSESSELSDIESDQENSDNEVPYRGFLELDLSSSRPSSPLFVETPTVNVANVGEQDILHHLETNRYADDSLKYNLLGRFSFGRDRQQTGNIELLELYFINN